MTSRPLPFHGDSLTPSRGDVRRGIAPSSSEVARLPSGEEALDRLLGGGFVRGELTEIFGPRSSGKTSIAYRSLAAATGRGEIVALVDPGDRFHPRRAEAAGVRLSSFLWIRPPDPLAALRACDALLAARGFGLVVFDLADGLPGPSRPRFATAWERLRRRAAASRSALLLLSRDRLSGSSAGVCLRLGQGRASWTGSERGLTLPLLLGLDARAEVVRDRRGAPGSRARLALEER